MNIRREESAAGQLTGVVLAAGFGSRLAGVSDTTQLKPLTPVAGRPLMARTLTSLSVAGCDRVVVVVGYCGAEIRDAILSLPHGEMHVEIVENDLFNLSNGVSVLKAAPFLSGRFLLTMADHVFSDDVMRLAGSHHPPAGGATLLIDRKLDTIFDMDDATKVLSNGDRIQEIGKEIDPFDCVDTGLFVCTDGLISALQCVFEEKGDASLSEGVARLATAERMTILDIDDGFWQDVDTPEMLREAERRLGRMEKGC